jgi:raffinose/stachyose/melibiose transport system permease protein
MKGSLRTDAKDRDSPARCEGSSDQRPDIYQPIKRGPASNAAKRDFAISLYVLPALLFIVLFLCWPLLTLFHLSLHSWNLLGPMRFVGINNFVRLFSDTSLLNALQNTFELAIFGPLIQTALALFLAAMIMSAGPAKILYRTAIFAPVTLALVAVGIVWILIYNPSFGLVNSAFDHLGLQSLTRVWLGDKQTALPAVLVIALWRWTGFNVVIFMAGLQGLPQDVYEAARIDGASSWKQFVHVTVPLIAPFTLLNFLINLIGYIKLFDVVYITTKGGPDHATELLSTYTYKQAFEFFNIGMASSAAVVLFVITAVLVFGFFLYWRWSNRGEATSFI